MGFALEGVCVMDYCGLIGFGMKFPANQLGGPKTMGFKGLRVIGSMG